MAKFNEEKLDKLFREIEKAIENCEKNSSIDLSAVKSLLEDLKLDETRNKAVRNIEKIISGLTIEESNKVNLDKVQSTINSYVKESELYLYGYYDALSNLKDALDSAKVDLSVKIGRSSIEDRLKILETEGYKNDRVKAIGNYINNEYIQKIDDSILSLKQNKENVDRLENEKAEKEESLKSETDSAKIEELNKRIEEIEDELSKIPFDSKEEIENEINRLDTNKDLFNKYLNNINGYIDELSKNGYKEQIANIAYEILNNEDLSEEVKNEFGTELFDLLRTSVTAYSNSYRLGFVAGSKNRSLEEIKKEINELYAELKGLEFSKESPVPEISDDEYSEQLKTVLVVIKKLDDDLKAANSKAATFEELYNKKPIGVTPEQVDEIVKNALRLKENEFNSDKRKLKTVAITAAALAGVMAVGWIITGGVLGAQRNQARDERDNAYGYISSAAEGSGILSELMNGNKISDETKAKFDEMVANLKNSGIETVVTIGNNFEGMYNAAIKIGEIQPGDSEEIKAYLDFIYQIKTTQDLYNQIIADESVSEEERAQLNAQLAMLDTYQNSAITQFNREHADYAIVETKDGNVLPFTTNGNDASLLSSVFTTAANYYDLKNSSEKDIEDLKAKEQQYIGLLFETNGKLVDMLTKANAEGFKGFTETEISAFTTLAGYTDDIKATYQEKYGAEADFATDFGSIVTLVNTLSNKNVNQNQTIADYAKYINTVADTINGLYTVDEKGNVTPKPVYTIDADGNVVDNSSNLIAGLIKVESEAKLEGLKLVSTELANMIKGTGSIQNTQKEYEVAINQINSSINAVKKALEDGSMSEEEASKLLNDYATAKNQFANEYITDYLDLVEFVKNMSANSAETIKNLNGQIADLNTQIADKQTEIDNLNGDKAQLESDKLALEAERDKLLAEIEELKNNSPEELLKQLEEHKKSTTFVNALYVSIFGTEPEGKTEEEIRMEVAKALGYTYEELGGTTPGVKDEFGSQKGE